MKIKFTKYQGTGNDFVLLDGTGSVVELSKEQIAAICNRRFGVGADGLMVLEKADRADVDFTMRYYNSDGGESTMCGNGGRCIVRFAEDLGIGGKEKKFIAIDGIHTAVIEGETIEISMNSVDRIHRVQEGWVLDTGSPHLVVEGKYDQEKARRLRQVYDANINFVEGIQDNTLKIKTYERGVETMTYACGTGAVAVAVVASQEWRKEREKWWVKSPGGELEVKFKKDDKQYSEITLKGNALKVFCGTIQI